MGILEAVYTYVDTSLCIAGILMNCFLTYCVLFKSPKSIATYSFLLLNTAMSNLTTCCITLFVEPRFVVEGENFYYIANGLCKYVGKKACTAGYSAMVSIYGHISWSELASFVYRWYVLKFDPPSKKQMILVLIIIALPSFCVFFFFSLPYFSSNWDMDFNTNVSRVHPELDLTDLPVLGAPGVQRDIRASITTFWIGIPIFPTMAYVFWLRSRILKLIADKDMLSDQAKKLHKAFLRALSIQAGLPIFFVIGVLLFWAMVVFQIHSIATEYGAYLMAGMIPILSPLCPLFCVGPYRNFIKELVKFNRAKLEPIMPSIVSSVNTSSKAYSDSQSAHSNSAGGKTQ